MLSDGTEENHEKLEVGVAAHISSSRTGYVQNASLNSVTTTSTCSVGLFFCLHVFLIALNFCTQAQGSLL
jgi:hypothetical protein